jgi:hypothetical protein
VKFKTSGQNGQLGKTSIVPRKILIFLQSKPQKQVKAAKGNNLIEEVGGKGLRLVMAREVRTRRANHLFSNSIIFFINTTPSDYFGTKIKEKCPARAGHLRLNRLRGAATRPPEIFYQV